MAKKKSAIAPKPAAKPTSNGAMLVLVVALIAVEHDGERYQEGDEFTVSSKAAKALADVNAVEVLNESVAAETSDSNDEGDGSNDDSTGDSNTVEGDAGATGEAATDATTTTA